LRSRKFRTLSVLIVAGILIGSLAIVEVLFDPLSWLLQMDTADSIYADLLAAKERWQSQEVTEYTIDVEGFIPLSCMVNATLTVRDSQLVAVEDHGSLLRESADQNGEGIPIEPERWDAPFCSYRDLLVPEMYARVEQDLNRIDWSQDKLEVSFEAKYGYVTGYQYDCCYRQGILNTNCSDCNFWFSFSNFEPMNGS
jgi:hypothetical protein